jgi:hypothetical protein
MLMRTCTKCFLQKPIEDFPWKSKLLGKRHTVCKECTAKRSNDWYQDNRDAHIKNVMENKVADRERARRFVADYLSSRRCVLCGETDPVVLEFDHIRGKKADVARLVADGATIERIQSELDLCQVLCANCHRRKTAKERGFFRRKLGHNHFRGVTK